MRARKTGIRAVQGAVVAFVAAIALGATPPSLVNYQGVLRDSAGNPLTGNYDMVFRLFDAPSAGNEILVDSHLASGTGAVAVSSGQFNTSLGGGTVTDGSGSGTYTNLADVFRDFPTVYLGVTVTGSGGPETMNSRIRLVGSPYSSNTSNFQGLGTGAFLQTGALPQTKNGILTIQNGSMMADLADAGYGITATGPNGGGYFRTLDQSGSAFLGFGSLGVYAKGVAAGGYFESNLSGSNAYIGESDYGIDALGSTGGRFASTGSGYALIADGDSGIEAYGNTQGGYFKDANNAGYARVGNGDVGIYAYGTYGSTNSGEAGHFKETTYSGEATIADGDTGVIGFGSYAAGIFRHGTSSSYNNEVRLATATSAIESAAPKNFIQNHPYDPTRLIVYTSLEGDEVGTYTRGSARLQGGAVHVPLGETFAWVTNPDIGLTAQVTPRGEWADLYVESLTTSELIVRSRDGRSSALFDYVVMGLRVGFEEASVVRERDVDAWLPSMAPNEQLFSAHPELRRLTALERFKTMRHQTGDSAPVDLANSLALRSAIGVYDPAVHGTPKGRLLSGPPVAAKSTVEENAAPRAGGKDQAAQLAPSAGREASPERDSPAPAIARAATGEAPSPAASNDLPGAGDSGSCRAIPFPVSEPVEAGDLLALDPLAPGMLRRTASAADLNVVGIAAEPSQTIGKELIAPLSGRMYALVKADADYGGIAPGDLLTSSPTPGHAMRATQLVPGAIIGKALDPLASGRGLLRILVLAH